VLVPSSHWSLAHSPACERPGSEPGALARDDTRASETWTGSRPLTRGEAGAPSRARVTAVRRPWAGVSLASARAPAYGRGRWRVASAASRERRRMAAFRRWCALAHAAARRCLCCAARTTHRILTARRSLARDVWRARECSRAGVEPLAKPIQCAKCRSLQADGDARQEELGVVRSRRRHAQRVALALGSQAARSVKRERALGELLEPQSRPDLDDHLDRGVACRSHGVHFSGPADDRLSRAEHTLDAGADRAHSATNDTDALFLSRVHVKWGRRRTGAHPERESKKLASCARGAIRTRNPLPHGRSLDRFTKLHGSGLHSQTQTLAPRAPFAERRSSLPSPDARPAESRPVRLMANSHRGPAGCLGHATGAFAAATTECSWLA
jgi:hypothetical protein